MRTIIAGSRSGFDYTDVEKAMESCGWEPTEIVSGMANGVDTLGEIWAKEHDIPIKQFPADWTKLGRRAGPIRNAQMGDYADALVAVWDGYSVGTKHMIYYARTKGLKVYVYNKSDYTFNFEDLC